MWRSIAYLVLILGVVFACEYGRTPGLFKHGFTNTVGDDNYVAETGEDTSAAYGDSASVTFTSLFAIYGSTGLNTVKTCDSGIVMFGTATITEACPTYSGLSPTVLTIPIFAMALWMLDSSVGGVEYRFKFQHLKASDLNNDGLDIGPALCGMQRMQTIIGDCPDDELRGGDKVPTEMLIVTWQIKDAVDTYYFQLVLSVTDGSTHVAFLYEAVSSVPSAITSYQSGFVRDSGGKFAAVCPFTTTGYDSGASLLHQQSNCRCGSWNQGIYLFETSGSSCTQTLLDYIAGCSADITGDNTNNFEMACRASRNLQDTCLENVFCRDLGTSREINIKIHNPPFTINTAINFVDQSDFTAGTVTQLTDPSCKATLTHNATVDVYEWTTTVATGNLATCDFIENAEEITFVTRVYDATDPDIDKAGVIYLRAVCDLLPSVSSVSVDTGSVLSSDLMKGGGRRVVMFFNTHRYYTFTDDSTVIPAAAVVQAGQDLFLAIGYDYGDLLPRDGVDPYGIYAYDCKVSNNALFDGATGDNKVIQLTTADTGCVATSLTANKAFYIEESFKCNLYSGGTLATTGSPDMVDTTFNYVITAAKFDAAKWLIGGSDKIYAQCKVGFCRNQAFAASSRCADTCGNTDVDYATARKRRNANETDFNDPEIIVQASVSVIDSQDRRSHGAQPRNECISNVVAYSTLLALCVLILAAMGVTSILFARLYARQRKRM